MFKDKKKYFFLKLFILFTLIRCSSSVDSSESFYYLYIFENSDESAEEASIVVNNHFGEQQRSILPLSIGIDKVEDSLSIYYYGSIYNNIETDLIETLNYNIYSNYFSFKVLKGTYYSISITNESENIIQRYKVKTDFYNKKKVYIENSVIYNDKNLTGEIFVSSNKTYSFDLIKR